MSQKAWGFVGVLFIVILLAFFLKTTNSNPQTFEKATNPTSSNEVLSSFEKADPLENSPSQTWSPSIGTLTPSADPTPEQSGLREYHGRVVDKQGQGIPDAFVFIRVFGMHHTKPVRTNKEGFFKFISLANADIELTAVATPFQTQKKSFQLDQIPELILLEMVQGKRLELEVLSEFGKPIEGALIQFESFSERITDKNGYAIFDELSDPAELSITADAFLPLKLSVKLSEKKKVVTLDHERRIQGQVIDKLTQLPVASFTLKFFGQTDSPYQESLRIETSDGRFELDKLDRNARSFSISADGFLPYFSEKIWPWVGEEQHERLFELDSNPSVLEGTVTNSEGLPIEGAEVYLLTKDPQMQNYSESFPTRTNGFWEIPSKEWLHGQLALTNAEGHFKVGPVPQNLFLALLASKPGFGAVLQKDIHQLEDQKRSEITIQLQDTAHLQVEVGFETSERILTGENVYGEEFHFDLAYGQKSLEINNLPPGYFSASLRVNLKDNKTRGSTSSISLLKEIELLPGGNHHMVFAEPKKRKLAGQALLNDHPFANVRLLASSQSSRSTTPYEAFSDGTGYFDFGEIYEETYSLVATSEKGKTFYLDGDKSAAFPLQEDIQNALLNFHSSGTVTGRILNAPVGSRLHYWVKTVKPPGSSSAHGSSLSFSNSKVFSISNVFPGQYFSLHLDIPDAGIHYFILEIPMPADGSDLDLGDLDYAQEPRLRLKLEAPPETIDHSVGFQVTGLDGTFSTRLANISLKKPQLTIAQYFLKAATISPLLNSSWESEPEEASFLFEDQAFYSQTFNIRQVTSLTIRLTAKDTPFVPLKEVMIRNLEEDTAILLESVTNDNLRGSFFRNDSVQIRKVPPGPTEIIMVLYDGRSMRIQETLRQGMAQNLEFNIANFE